jgi:hypothetical protein
MDSNRFLDLLLLKLKNLHKSSVLIITKKEK